MVLLRARLACWLARALAALLPRRALEATGEHVREAVGRDIESDPTKRVGRSLEHARTLVRAAAAGATHHRTEHDTWH